jgi:oligopeptide transport system substrate-binding protein
MVLSEESSVAAIIMGRRGCMKCFHRRYAGLAIVVGVLCLFFATPGAAEQVLHRGNGTEPESLDFHTSSSVASSNIQRDIAEGLVSLAADASLIPGAAERWEISPEGTLYTFHLRGDGKWSNGEPLTAQDFVYSFRRAVDPKTASNYAFILYPIKNAEEIATSKIQDLSQLGVTATDDLTLQITLKGPTPYFLAMLTHSAAFPVHRKTVEKFDDQWTRPENIVSNGAFKLVEWVPQSHIKLVKNPHYRDHAEIKLDAVHYYPTEDIHTEMKRFRAGELDITYQVPTDQIEWAKKNLGQEYRNTPYLGVYYYSLGVGYETPFAPSEALRHALALAVDRDILIDKITQGGELPAYSFVPPGVMDYESQNPDHSGKSQGERDAMAKKLYAEAGYSEKNPLEISLLYNTSEKHKKIAIAIAGMWKKLPGLKVNMVNEEWKSYIVSRKQGKYDVVRAGWVADYNDANSFLEVFQSSSGLNYGKYRNTEYDRLIADAAVTLDSKKRADMLQQAERILLKDLPVIPIYHYASNHLVKAHVKGWKDNIMDYHLSQYMSVEK